MTQQNNSTNWLLKGTNGQQHMIKLVQPTGRQISGIITSGVPGQPVKLYKSANNPETSQAFTGTQVLRTIGTTSKLVSTKLQLGQNVTKAIRLTPAQMKDLKLVNTGTTRIQPTTATTLPATHSITLSTQAQNNAKKNTPILSRKRQDPLEMIDGDMLDEYIPKRVRKSEKVGKGLRHFSMKVCEKVKQKGVTSYNEVADELVGEFTNSSSTSLADQYDQKNIRRRVYDALNVLMAMNIILKDKKEIKWIGLPTNSLQECHQLQSDIKKKERIIKEKQNQLNELILNLLAFKNLAQRNKENERIHGPPPPNSYIQLPFIVVNTNRKTVINCSISNDKMEYLFQFSDKFEINDDVEILKSIGVLKGLDKGECTPEDLEKMKTLIPESLWPYVNNIASGKLDMCAGTSSTSFNLDEFVETTLEEDNSRQSSSFDPLSPNPEGYSDEEDTDMSSDTEPN